MIERLKLFWRLVRRISGDDGYDRYLQHYADRHQNDSGQAGDGPLSKAEFFRRWQEQKWNGVKRCC
jgi:uncharacterized short protein YbdD (DUF466 family)